MQPTQTDQLDHALAVLDTVVTPEDRRQLDALRERLSTRRLRILIAGEAKRGKSTLLNQLLLREILPTGVTPVTAIATTVRSADDTDAEHALVVFEDGHHEQHELSELADFVSERGNPDNLRRVDGVELSVRSELLDRYRVEFVDTPGTGSVYEHNTAAAERVLDTLDAAIVVVTADPPVSAAERDLLKRVSQLSVHTFIVLNKADQLDADDLAEAVEFTSAVCAAAAGRDLPIYSCSARAGRDDPGFRRFADAVQNYLADRGVEDAAAALRGHLLRLAEATLDAARLTERTLQLSATTSADRVSLFRDRMEEIAARRHTLDDRCWAAERRMRRSLDEAAAQHVAELTAQCRREAATALDGPLAQLTPDEVESQGRELVVRTIQVDVDQWRSDQAQAVEHDLASVTGQAVAEVETQLSDLRTAAHELLDLDLTAHAVAHELRPSQRFWYAFDRGVGWEPPLTDAARHLLPGRRGRARARVLDEIAELVDRQLGRARADLAERLRETVRTVVAKLRAEHDQVLGRVRSALDEAAKLHAGAEGERGQGQTELSVRTSALLDLLQTLRNEPATRVPS